MEKSPIAWACERMNRHYITAETGCDYLSHVWFEKRLHFKGKRTVLPGLFRVYLWVALPLLRSEWETPTGCGLSVVLAHSFWDGTGGVAPPAIPVRDWRCSISRRTSLLLSLPLLALLLRWGPAATLAGVLPCSWTLLLFFCSLVGWSVPAATLAGA